MTVGTAEVVVRDCRLMVFHPFMNFMNTKTLNDSLVNMIITMATQMIPTSLEIVIPEMATPEMATPEMATPVMATPVMATPETLLAPEIPTIDRPSSGMTQTKKSPLGYVSI